LATITDFAWFGLLTLFVLSLVVYGRSLLRNAALRAALIVMGVSVLLYCTVFYGNFRYRAPLEPLMLLVVAPLVTRLWEIRTNRRDVERQRHRPSGPLARP
jgi:hypothetical protein